VYNLPKNIFVPCRASHATRTTQALGRRLTKEGGGRSGDEIEEKERRGGEECLQCVEGRKADKRDERGGGATGGGEWDFVSDGCYN
jgi:hypothetical protein